MQLLNVPLLFLIVRRGRGTVSAPGGGNGDEGFLEFNQETGRRKIGDEENSSRWRSSPYIYVCSLSFFRR